MNFQGASEMPLPDVSGISGMPVKDRDFSGQRFRELPAGTHFVDCDFSRTKWEGVSLNGHYFSRCRFDECLFDACLLKGVKIFECYGANAILRETVVSECHFEAGQWDGVLWLQNQIIRLLVNAADCPNWEFRQCDISYLTLSSSQLDKLVFQRSSVKDASFVECVINRGRWEETQLDRVIVANSRLGSTQWLDCHGVNNRFMGMRGDALEYRSCHFEQVAWSRCELNDVSYLGNSLRIVQFDSAQLNCVTFRDNLFYVLMFDHAQLKNVSLREKEIAHLSLRHAQLDSCDLRGISAPGMDARGCQLRETLLDGAHFPDANLIGQKPCDWQSAKLGHTVFSMPEEQQDADWWRRLRPGIRREQ